LPRRPLFGYTRREHGVALGVFAAVTLLFFFPLLRGETFSDVAGRQQQIFPWAGVVPHEEHAPVLHYDQDDTVYPWQVFMNRELRAGNFPLWNPHSFAGAPFFANGQNGVLYPPRLALSYTVSPARVHDLLLVLHFFAAGVAMFVLLGYFGLSFRAALIGGLAWMLNTFALSWQALEHYVVIEVGLPVGVLLADLAVRRRSWGAAWALGIVLGLVFLGGNVLFVELAVLAVLAYGVALSIVDTRRDLRRIWSPAAKLGTALLLCVGLAAISILPTSALAGESARVSLSYHELSKFALSWSDLQFIFRPPPDPFKLDPYHLDLFAGSVTGALALVGLLRATFAARFAAVMAVLALLFALHTPVTYVVSSLLPGFGNFKPLSRSAFLFQFGLAVLAAYGVETLLERMARSSRRKLSASWASVAFVTVVCLSVVAQEWLWKRDVMIHQPASARYLYPETPLTRELEADGLSRFLPTYPTFRGSTAMIYGLRSAGGYESLLPARTQDFWRVIGDRLAPQELASKPLVYAYHPAYDLAKVQPGLLARASVAAVFAAPPNVVGVPVRSGLALQHAGSDGRIFRVDGALPLAYVVGGCEEVETPLAALDRFISDDFHPSDKVILERSSLTDAGLSCAGSVSGRAGTAHITAHPINSLAVVAEASRPAWLVISESWDHGWSATVDGRPADVLPADSAFRAVRLSPGLHIVHFSYAPSSFTLGIVVSSVSLGVALGGIVILLWTRRRLRRSSANGRKPSRRVAGPTPD
jgi:Bacterial membrane protein YfhO